MTIPEMLDALQNSRTQRIALNKKVEAMDAAEKKLKADIITAMKVKGVTTFELPHYKLEITPKVKPVAEDWSLIYSFIKKNEAFDLLQRRLTETAVKARWAEDITIPGINKFPVDDLSITSA